MNTEWLGASGAIGNLAVPFWWCSVLVYRTGLVTRGMETKKWDNIIVIGFEYVCYTLIGNAAAFLPGE